MEIYGRYFCDECRKELPDRASEYNGNLNRAIDYGGIGPTRTSYEKPEHLCENCPRVLAKRWYNQAREGEGKTMTEPQALEASPRPWRVSIFTSTQGEHPTIISESYDHVGSFASFDTIMSFEHGGHFTRQRWEATARLIVRAVNSHDANEARLDMAAKLADAVIELDAAIEGGHKVPRLEGKVCALAHAFQDMKND